MVVFTGKELTRRRTDPAEGVGQERRPEGRPVARTTSGRDRPVPPSRRDRPAVEKQRILEQLHGSKEILRGRKVLVVDDDVRNIFALTSLLENHDMDVISATNGHSAIELIRKTPDLSMVLMDIMMPDMDGYETMREIRKSRSSGPFRSSRSRPRR